MSSFRNFGIAFLVALLIFGGTAYLALGYVSELFQADADEIKKNGPGSEEFLGPVNPGTVDPIKSGRSFNMVIIGTDYDPEIYKDYTEPSNNGDKLFVARKVKATTILFVRFDKEHRALRIASIPAETQTTVDCVPMTLGQSYSFKGSDYIKNRVASLVGMSVDFVFEFSGREFAEFTQKRLLSRDFSVPVNVTTGNDKGLSPVTFRKGQIINNESAVYTLLHHTDYPITAVGDRHLLLSNFFLQTISKLSVTNNPSVYYNNFISRFKTDMSENDVKELIEVLYTLPLYIGSKEAPTTVSTVSIYKCGSYMSDGTFRADQAAVRAAFDFESTNDNKNDK